MVMQTVDREVCGMNPSTSLHPLGSPPSQHRSFMFTRMLIVINFARDESFQLVVIGQKVLVSNTAAGTDGRAGIDVTYTISSTSRHLTFPLFKKPETSNKA